jgi:hypothetical protein
MGSGISILLTSSDHRRLVEIAADRNSPQKHVWRAQIVLLSAQGVGTNEIMRASGKAKTCVWRWQRRFMEAGTDGLLVDKTRPSRIPPLGETLTERVVALTLSEPPGEVTHWTATAVAAACAISVSSVHRIWRSHGLRPHQMRQFTRIPGREVVAINHICLTALDLDQTLAELAQAGILLTRPLKLGADDNRQAWIEDPDGIRIELMEMARDSLQDQAVRAPPARARSPSRGPPTSHAQPRSRDAAVQAEALDPTQPERAGLRAKVGIHAQACGFPGRAGARSLHTRRSAMTFTVAARTTTHSAAFDTVSIVPSMSMA